MSAGDELNAALTHEKLDKLIAMIAELIGRIEALEASVEDIKGTE